MHGHMNVKNLKGCLVFIKKNKACESHVKMNLKGHKNVPNIQF